MKNNKALIGALCIALLCLLHPGASDAQISNDNINVSMKPYQIKYDLPGNNSDGGGDINGEGTLLAFTTYGFSQPNNSLCYTWDVLYPLPYTKTVGDYTWGYKEDAPFLETGRLSFNLWEDDGDACVYDGGEDDDDWIQGTATFVGSGPPFYRLFFTEGGANLPSRWRQNHNPNEDNWLNTINDIWDIKVKSAWRYTNGDVCSSPLQFGSISINSAVSHVNSTTGEMLDETPSAEGILTYTDQAGSPSNDVYYSFTLSEPMQVEISTESTTTTFDTYLYLYSNNCNDLLAENDDIESGILQSEIVTSLLAGTYVVMVDGFDTSDEGDFELALTTSPSTLGTEELNLSHLISVYPNPAQDLITIDLGDEFSLADVRIINALGQVIYKSSVGNGKTIALSVRDYEPGMYTVLIDGDDKVAKKKIIVQ